MKFLGRSPMLNTYRKLCCSLLVFLGVTLAAMGQQTYCNPLNLDYTYMIYDAHKGISYRSGADPAVVRFRDAYYMFVTRSMGYWHSEDLHNWNFIKPRQWYFEGSNAPAAHNYRDSVLYMAGNPSGSMSILYSDKPEKGIWNATPAVVNGLQDPALFIDDDRQAYMYWGSSNKFPIRVRKLDRKLRFKPDETVTELIQLEPEKHGWERFGENHADTVLKGYLEGAWMTKHQGTYYLQYAAPGTEFNVYGDGVYTSNSPLGPFEYAPNNPFSYKPGGFITGAGHGSTVRGPGDQYWHFGTMAVNINIGWERRIGMFPTYFDKDGLLYTDTYFGDYPHFGPTHPQKGQFSGWMLLSYRKPVTASSSLEGFPAENITDENIKTFWVAEDIKEGVWLQIDLQQTATIHAFQLNYHDYKSDLYGRIPDLHHQYLIEGSEDGKQWQILVDKRDNTADVPNDYVELSKPAKARYIRFTNKHVPTPYLSLSGLRIFGLGQGRKPAKVKGFHAERQSDLREVDLSWETRKNVQGYNVLWGIAPDKLYSSWMVYGANELNIKALNTDQTYYFAIEAFNENGVSDRSEMVITPK